MTSTPAFLPRAAVPVFLVVAPALGIAIPLYLGLPIEAAVLLAALVPTALAVGLLALTEGRSGVGALLRGLLPGRVGLQWYAVAVGLPLAIHLAVGGLALLLGYIPALQLRPLSLTQLIVGVIIVILAVLEELGWRGYVLPRLLAKRSALAAALVIGVAWGLFHLGLGAADGRPLLPTFLVPFAASVIFTWLFVQTRGSLLLAVLFHAALNFFPSFLDGLTVAQSIWLQAVVLLALGAGLWLFLGTNLRRGAAEQGALAESV